MCRQSRIKKPDNICPFLYLTSILNTSPRSSPKIGEDVAATIPVVVLHSLFAGEYRVQASKSIYILEKPLISLDIPHLVPLLSHNAIRPPRCFDHLSLWQRERIRRRKRELEGVL